MTSASGSARTSVALMGLSVTAAPGQPANPLLPVGQLSPNCWQAGNLLLPLERSHREGS